MIAKYRNSGQTCVCTNRFYVQAGIYDAFADKLAEAAKRLKVGPGHEKDTTQGPLIDKRAVAKVEEHIADAVKKGGKVVAGGKLHALGGTFFEPTVIRDATQEMAVAKEETFGPLSPIFRFETEEEAVAQANDTEFGLACYFYTRDLARTFRVSQGLRYGLVGVNAGHDHHRGRPLRRHEGIGPGPRRLQIRLRRLPRHQICLRGGSGVGPRAA